MKVFFFRPSCSFNIKNIPRVNKNITTKNTVGENSGKRRFVKIQGSPRGQCVLGLLYTCKSILGHKSTKAPYNLSAVREICAFISPEAGEEH